VILYSSIVQRDFGSRAAELLDLWTGYFGEINAEGTEQPLIHMLLLDLDPDLYDQAADDPERRLAAWFGKFAARPNKRARDRPLLHPVELLHSVETDLIENWIEATGAQLGRPADEIEELRLRARDELGEIAVLRARDVERWVRDFRPGNEGVGS
jgi:hypothetical protein